MKLNWISAMSVIRRIKAFKHGGRSVCLSVECKLDLVSGVLNYEEEFDAISNLHLIFQHIVYQMMCFLYAA